MIREFNFGIAMIGSGLMFNIKVKWLIVKLSILMGLMVFSAPFLNQSFAEEINAVATIAPQSGVSVETNNIKNSPIKAVTNFNKSQSKEKPKDNVIKKHNLSYMDENKVIEKLNEYALGPEDRLKVTVFGEKELTGDYRVGSDGTIAFPLIGDIAVEGMTLRQAEEAIKSGLRNGYLKKPSVSIEVIESRPFYILGEVRRPGSYNYVSGMSVLQAVAISGGFTYRANRKHVEILRGNKAPADPIDTTPSEKIKPGDIIFIQERFF